MFFGREQASDQNGIEEHGLRASDKKQLKVEREQRMWRRDGNTVKLYSRVPMVGISERVLESLIHSAIQH